MNESQKLLLHEYPSDSDSEPEAERKPNPRDLSPSPPYPHGQPLRLQQAWEYVPMATRSANRLLHTPGRPERRGRRIAFALRMCRNGGA
jgi:hypothetical protein